MCGLCGIVGPNLGPAEWDLFKHLMIVSTLRGEDGAGIVAVPMKSGKDFTVLRTAGCAADLATGREFLSLRSKQKWACFMGHARYPTRGTWDIEDVHPHVSGPIFGMHNGSMDTVNGEKIQKDQSDSRALFTCIRNMGIDNTMANSEGAYALSYINKATDQLCFVRNAGRTLYFMQVAGLPFIAWASERGFLDLIADRTPGIADKAVSIYKLPPGQLVTFRLRNSGVVKYLDYRPLVVPKPVTVDKTPVPPHVTHEKATQMWETVRGHYLTEEELTVALISGCANCNRTSDITDFRKGKTFWYDKTEFICDDCAEHDQLARDYLKSHGVTPPPVYTHH